MACCAVCRYDIQNVPEVVSHLYCFDQDHPSDSVVTCLCKKISHVHASLQAHVWPFLTFVVTIVNMRHLFSYKPSEDALVHHSYSDF